MKNLLLLISCIMLLSSCGGECKMKVQLEAANAELAAAKMELASLKPVGANADRVLIHNVFFKTKPGMTEAEMSGLTTSLQRLEEVKSAGEVWVGKPAATGDPRLVTDYQVALQVTFASEADLAAYQQDPLHLKMREETSKYFVAPPVVYDFWARRNK